MPLIRKGDQGSEVADIQRRLRKLGYDLGSTGIDAIFGDKTEEAVKKFQQDRGLLVDGIVGDDTWQELVEATYFLGDRNLYLKSPYFRGDDVKNLQTWLTTLGFYYGPIDGIYGLASEKAIREFQKNSGIPEDGIIGSSTLDVFHRLQSILETKAPLPFPPKREEALSSISSLKERKIVVDLGHGFSEHGAKGPTGLTENEVVYDIGTRFGNLLELLGAKVIFTRKIKEDKNLLKRVGLANSNRAHLFLSFHLNSSSNPKAEGTSTYYFATSYSHSQKGKKLAHLIHQELVDSLQTKDGRVHGKNFAVLRLTEMTAVLIEPVFITNPREEALLKKSSFRQKIAVAVFDGLRKYLS